MNRTKKQHYVPQSYLENWSIPGQHHVYVFDKYKDEVRTNNIEDIASENYFYDLNFAGVFSEAEIKQYQLDDIDLSKIDNNQYIENYFANHIESIYKQSLDKIITRVRSMSEWEMRNCFFIQPERVYSLAILLVLQRIRVKSIRDTIVEMTDMLGQALTENNAPQSMIDEYASLSKNQLKLLHGKMIVDNSKVLELANVLSNHIWILLKNKTKHQFFTSDNPIGTIAHSSNPYLSMSGLASEGVEIYFPISPDMMLIMYEKTYHSKLTPMHCRILETENEEMVNYYNSHCIINSSRCVFSQMPDFSIVSKIKSLNPEILHLPKTSLSFGGKTYKPTKKK